MPAKAELRLIKVVLFIKTFFANFCSAFRTIAKEEQLQRKEEQLQEGRKEQGVTIASFAKV